MSANAFGPPCVDFRRNLTHGAIIDIEAFSELYGLRCQDDRIKVPKAIEFAFRGIGSSQESAIRTSLDQYRTPCPHSWARGLLLR
jgi:hypothetical protein